ncbi:hypothetical protein MMC16_001743 [Acarospora aff. strigata]|nr:hypothetical protein [Acarospora aff. strigata]
MSGVRTPYVEGKVDLVILVVGEEMDMETWVVTKEIDESITAIVISDDDELGGDVCVRDVGMILDDGRSLEKLHGFRHFAFLNYLGGFVVRDFQPLWDRDLQTLMIRMRHTTSEVPSESKRENRMLGEKIEIDILHNA